MTGRQHRYGIGLCCRADTSKSMQHQPPHPGGITVQAAVQPAPPVVAHMIADFLGIQLTPKTNRRQRLQPRTRWQLANENGSGSWRARLTPNAGCRISLSAVQEDWPTRRRPEADANAGRPVLLYSSRMYRQATRSLAHVGCPSAVRYPTGDAGACCRGCDQWRDLRVCGCRVRCFPFFGRAANQADRHSVK